MIFSIPVMMHNAYHKVCCQNFYKIISYSDDRLNSNTKQNNPPILAALQWIMDIFFYVQ